MIVYFVFWFFLFFMVKDFSYMCKMENKIDGLLGINIYFFEVFLGLEMLNSIFIC